MYANGFIHIECINMECIVIYYVRLRQIIRLTIAHTRVHLNTNIIKYN